MLALKTHHDDQSVADDCEDGDGAEDGHLGHVHLLLRGGVVGDVRVAAAAQDAAAVVQAPLVLSDKVIETFRLENFLLVTHYSSAALSLSLQLFVLLTAVKQAKK